MCRKFQLKNLFKYKINVYKFINKKCRDGIRFPVMKYILDWNKNFLSFRILKI